MPTWLSYTLLRVLLFLAPLTILLAFQVDPFISAAIAALFGLSASILFLRRRRESMSTSIHQSRTRETTHASRDDESEDAVIDATENDRRG